MSSPTIFLLVFFSFVLGANHGVVSSFFVGLVCVVMVMVLLSPPLLVNMMLVMVFFSPFSALFRCACMHNTSCECYSLLLGVLVHDVVSFVASFFPFPCLLQPHHSNTITFLLCAYVHGIGCGVVSPFFCGTFPLPFLWKRMWLFVLPILLPLKTSSNEVNFFSFKKYFFCIFYVFSFYVFSFLIKNLYIFFQFFLVCCFVYSPF